MAKKKVESVYRKFEDVEDTNVVFDKIKNGTWDLARFEAWKKQLELLVDFDAHADESF